MKTEFISNGTVPCSYFKSFGKKNGFSVQINGEEVVLDTTAKMKKHMDCFTDQETTNYVNDKLFNINKKNEVINLKIESSDIAEWLNDRNSTTKGSPQPSFWKSLLSMFGLNLGSHSKQEEFALPKDLYWNVDYDFSSQPRQVETALHANQLNSVLGTLKGRSGLYNEFEWIITLMNMGTQAIDFDLVAIEDPLTGEVSCS